MHDLKLSAVDMNLLVVLEALLTERQVSRAAAKVGLSPSATSHALTRLRELYEDPLLVRSGNAMVLTPRGTALLPGLTRGLSELRTTLTGEPRFEPRSARRVFRLGSVDYGQLILLPKLLARMEREAPGVDISVVHGLNLAELVQAGEIDLALGVESAVPSSLRSQALFSDGFVCMVRKRHPVTRGRWTLARYLALRHVVVAPSGGPGSLVDAELARRGKERRVALRVPNFLVAPQVVSESDFISTGPERLAARLAKVHPIRLLPPPLPLPRFTFAQSWHARFDEDPAHLWLRTTLAEISRAL